MLQICNGPDQFETAWSVLTRSWAVLLPLLRELSEAKHPPCVRCPPCARSSQKAN